MPIHLVLASQSPRRRQLLAETGRPFVAIPAEDVEEESPKTSADPAGLVVRNALKKARSIAEKLAGDPAGAQALVCTSGGDATGAVRIAVIGCDTVACVPPPGTNEVEILGKPADRADARRMLSMLSGSEHAVVSGLAVILVELPSTGSDTPLLKEDTCSETTTLYMEPLSENTLEDYLDSGAWEGKAGAFGYQDGIAWLRRLTGSESNIVGLPMELLTERLKALDGSKPGAKTNHGSNV